MMTYRAHLENEAATLAIGERIAVLSAHLKVIYLEGVLGAGKTTFTRGFLRGMDYQGTVKSPTYTLVETYPLAQRTIHHFDLYRIHDAHELEDMGIRDYFTQDTLCLIEWPERAEGHIPLPDLICTLEVKGEQRIIIITAQTIVGQACVQQLH